MIEDSRVNHHRKLNSKYVTILASQAQNRGLSIPWNANRRLLDHDDRRFKF